MIARFIERSGYDVVQDRCAKHHCGEEQVPDNTVAEEGNTGAVASHQSGEAARIHVPGRPDGEVANQEERNGARQSGSRIGMRERFA